MTLRSRSAALVVPRVARSPQHEPRGAIPAARIAAGQSFVQQRVGTFEHRPPITRANLSSNGSNRRSRRLYQVFRVYQSLFEGAGLASRSMSFPAAIIVEGVPAQLPAAAHMARTDARPTAAAGGDRATRATSAPRIRRDLSLRKGSALEPQRLPRRRFPLSPPFGVTSPMKTRSRLAVRHFLPMLPRDDRLTTAQTGGERPGDEAIRESRRQSARARNGRRDRAPERRRPAPAR